MIPERPDEGADSRGDSSTPNQEALFESLLVAYDEALARGDAQTPDESLVPRELQPRLRAALECLSLLAKSRRPAATPPNGVILPQAPIAPPAPFAPLPAPASLPGRIGRFQVLRELGRGGHGVVFLAVDPRLSRLVALKVPRPEVLMTPELHRRFLREARAASALAHPNLVPIHEAGDDGPVCYIAAAYCEGPTLASWLKQQKADLPFGEAAALIAVLADAVAHAHERGILHRDIKPANVLLAPADGPRSPGLVHLGGLALIPRLTDFGLARLLDDDASERTRTGATLGTPAYMASEQADGRTDEIGPGADVYALGVMLYELLVGRPPFRGANDLETLRLVSAAEIVPPSRLRSGTPRDLEAICLCALERKPSLRYATAAALADDLRRFIEGRPTNARPLGKLRQSVRWFRRRPLRAALIGVTLLALTTLAGGGWWYSARLATALEIARKARLHSDVLRYAADTRSAWQAYGSHHAMHANSLLAAAAEGQTEIDQRSFDWHLLWQRLHDERLTLRGHQGAVYAVTYSPDGRQLASASQDRSVRIWDAASGNCLASLEGHTDEVNMVVWSPDGRWLASGGDDGDVRIWHALKPRPLDALPREPHGAAVSLAFSPDGLLLASGYDDGTLVFTHTTDWRTERVVATGGKRIEMMAFSPDGALLATASGSSGVRVWEVAQVQSKPPRKFQDRWAFHVAFDRQARLAACGSEWAALWNLQTDRALMDLSLPSEHVQSLAFCLDDRYIALARRDAAVQLHEAPTAVRGHAFLGHSDRVWSIVASPDGQTLATASADKTIKIWGLTGSKAETVYELPNRVDALAFTPDGKSLLTATENGELMQWQAPGSESLADSTPRTGETRWQGPRRLSRTGEIAQAVERIAIAPDGVLAATCSTGDAGARLWNLRSGTSEGEPLVATEGEAIPTTSSVSFSPDGELLAQASDAKVFLWHVASRRVQAVLGDHGASVRALAFSPDGERLAVASSGQIHLWHHRDRRRLRSWTADGGQVNALAYTLDGRRLVSGGNDRLVKLWDTDSGAEAVVFSGHIEAVKNLAFSPDGRLLASAGAATVRLWSLSTYDELAAIDDFRGPIQALAFHPREMILAVGGQTPDERGEFRLWCGPPGTKWRPGATPGEQEASAGGEREASASR